MRALVAGVPYGRHVSPVRREPAVRAFEIRATHHGSRQTAERIGVPPGETPTAVVLLSPRSPTDSASVRRGCPVQPSSGPRWPRPKVRSRSKAAVEKGSSPPRVVLRGLLPHQRPLCSRGICRRCRGSRWSAMSPARRRRRRIARRRATMSARMITLLNFNIATSWPDPGGSVRPL
jgi:hypothetical protein